jgi:hypothetical protein
MIKKSQKVIVYIHHSYNKQLFLSVTIFTIILVAIYLTLDYQGTAEINLKSDNAFGFSCLRAKDLVVQEYDKKGDLWATRGMIVYKLKRGDNKFDRVAHVPTGLSIFWLRNFSILRRLTIRPECVEMTANEKGDICALSAGRIWLLPSGGKKFKETYKLSNYGFCGQGMRNDDIIDINDSTVFFGEYFENPNKVKVRIFKSVNNMVSWQEAYEFKAGQIRHIHAIQKDPYTEKLWVLTGDKDEESMIAWSDNDFKSIVPIGQGSQLWRVCQLVFTEKEIYWGTDTYSNDVSGIYRWNKKTAELEKLKKIHERVYFATKLANGTIVMSTDCEGTEDESDKLTRLYIITEDNKITSFDCGTWNHNKKGFWFKYAMLRFQRNQGGPSLAITCLNQKELPDGELIIISEETLLTAVKAR